MEAQDNPCIGDSTQNGKDTDANILHNYHHEDTNDFENVEHENHTNLAALTMELDDLCHRVQAGDGQPTEALHHIEHELQRLSIALCPSAPPEPLDDVHRHSMLWPKADKLHKHLNSGYTYL